MATFTKRIDSGIRDLWDRFQSAWEVRTTGETLGRFPDSPDPDVIYGLSLRFTDITIPQGATITSAKITFTAVAGQSSQHIIYKIYGVAEDNTGEFVASPIDDARTRSKVAHNVDWNQTITTTIGGEFDTPDFTSVIQDIINRAGWVSGNALAISIEDNGTSSNNTISQRAYENNAGAAALLTITYEAGGSPSVSPSSSVSPSRSPSSSVSASTSPSISPSSSASRSPSPSLIDSSFVLDISKDGKDVLHTNSPRDLKFSSRYGTLKYFTKAQQTISVDGSSGDFACKGVYTHNLGYKPYVEVFVRVYIGSPSGNYEYCPLFGSGASVAYNASYIVKDNTIEIYGEFLGVSLSVWNFDFLIFLYKNDLTL